MNDCDRAVIERYLTIVGEAREGAALYCGACHSRIIFHDGVWRLHDYDADA